MNGLRRRGTVVAISILTLIAAAGWLQLSIAPRDRTTPVDGAALTGVVRAGVSVATLSEAPGDTFAARRAQADLIAAISLVPSLTSDASRTELDALLIRALDTVQPLTSRSDDEVAGDVGERLARLADGIDSAVGAMVLAQSDDAQQGYAARSTVGVVGLVVSLLLGIGALLLLVGRRTRTSSATGVADTTLATPASARRSSGSPELSGESQSRSAASLPIDVLDATRFQQTLLREQSRSTRYGHVLSLITVSLVQEDSLAQHHGDDVFEYVLGSIAELACHNTRASDNVGVIEGNQIGVLLAETSVADAEHVAAKLRRSVEIFPFSDNITPTISTTCIDATEKSG